MTPGRALLSADLALAFILRWIVILGLAALFGLVGFGIVARAADHAFAARDEIVELVMIWTILAGTLALWRDDELYRVDALTLSFPKLYRGLRPLVETGKLAFAVVLTWKGAEFAFSVPEVTPFLGFNKAAIYGAIPAFGAIAAVYSFAGIIDSLTGGHWARAREVRTTGETSPTHQRQEQ